MCSPSLLPIARLPPLRALAHCLASWKNVQFHYCCLTFAPLASRLIVFSLQEDAKHASRAPLAAWHWAMAHTPCYRWRWMSPVVEDVLSHRITYRSRCTIYWTRLQPSILQNFHFVDREARPRTSGTCTRARRVSSCSVQGHEVMENALRERSNRQRRPLDLGVRGSPNPDELTVPDTDASPVQPVTHTNRFEPCRPVVLVHRLRVPSLRNSCFTRFHLLLQTSHLKRDVSKSMATRHFVVPLGDSGRHTRISCSGSSWTTLGLGLLGRRDLKRRNHEARRSRRRDEEVTWQGTQFAINRHRKSLQVCLKVNLLQLFNLLRLRLPQSSTYLPDLGVHARKILG